MILVRPNLQEFDLVTQFDLLADDLQFVFHLGREHRSAVLGGADDVVEQHRDVVTIVDVLGREAA